MDEMLPLFSPHYWLMLAVLLCARGLDFLSTWIATPSLMLEANPIAKALGWKLGALVNILLCLAFALWPLPSIILATASFLVAARNFQSAWIMRGYGEDNYRVWIVERMAQADPIVFAFCTGNHALIFAGIGAAILFWSRGHVVPFAMGMGMITYAVIVTIFTLLALYRARRSTSLRL